MKTKTKILASFTLTGVGFDPDEISSIIGIKPTKMWRLGDQIQNSALRRKHDGWRLSTGKEESWHLEDQVKLIISQIKPHISKIKDVMTQFDLKAELSGVVYIASKSGISEIPSIGFNEDIVKILAELNAGIDIDLYVKPDN